MRDTSGTHRRQNNRMTEAGSGMVRPMRSNNLWLGQSLVIENSIVSIRETGEGVLHREISATHSFSRIFFAVRSSFLCSSSTVGYFKSRPCNASRIAAPTAMRVYHFLSAGMTYHGAHFVLV